jgi:hypothetical protein
LLTLRDKSRKRGYQDATQKKEFKMTRTELSKLTDAQLNRGIMYQVREGVNIAALDAMLAERARRAA